ncbi:MAG: hypothetical protein ACI92Z_000773 [Paracoccaceae bacterium]|jgi:hypothetical protein
MPFQSPLSVDNIDVLGADTNGWRAQISGGLTLDKVHLGATDKARDKFVGQGTAKLHRAADLFDITIMQHNDFIGYGHGFDLVVGHVNHGGF